MRKLGILAVLFLTLSCGVHTIVVRPELVNDYKHLMYEWERCGINVQAVMPYPEPSLTSLPMNLRVVNIENKTAPKVLMHGEHNGLIVSPPILWLDVPFDVHHPYVGEWFPRYEQWLWFEVQRPGPNYCFFKVFLKTK